MFKWVLIWSWPGRRPSINRSELAQEEQAHREVYIALLRSTLTTRGSKGRLALAAGISPQYLSYLLNTGTEDSGTFRVPSPRVAEKIAAALPADPERRDAVRQHMYLASLRRLRGARMLATRAPGARAEEGEVRARVAEVGAAHHAATFTNDPLLARQTYHAVRDVCADLLRRLEPVRDALAFVDLCFLLHDAQCVLNCPADALYAAKRARSVLESLDADSRSRERLACLRVQAIRAETVAYHNLGLFRQAHTRCLEAEAFEAAQQEPDEHLIHVYRDKIDALLGLPRFAVSEVAGLADQVERICQRRANPLDPLWVVMTRRSEAHAYLRHGNLTRASQVMEAQVARMETVPFIGPLHRAMLLKVSARILWAAGARDAWEDVARRALGLAVAGGLTHQISELRREFGSALTPLLAAYEEERSQGMYGER
ncbi:MAG: hypothetical protein IVW57_07405 [Ktedonobacterales bacterium]|nr:hypothetical protein [Ktedonobacterales bacterium]